MSNQRNDVIVAGHICLDVIPELKTKTNNLSALLQPGKLIDVGQAMVATGGAVPNTGIALHKLGFSTTLMGKVGNDVFGQALLRLIKDIDVTLTQGMITTPGENSSYSIVISPPGGDRIFLHCPGANDTFSADDMDMDKVSEAKLFHFGYPSLMFNMFQNEGEELVNIFRKVKGKGLTTSLDMAQPDPESEAGKTDWLPILNKVMPYVDIFLPSFEEIVFMLDRELYDNLTRRTESSGILCGASQQSLSRIADQLLQAGAAIVVIKLGEHGLYMRTTDDEQRLEKSGLFNCSSTKAWMQRELLIPCFEVEVQGTTGAGDSTIAGFLGGLLQGLTPEQVLEGAVGVGSFNVQKPDAISGIPHWEEVQRFIKSKPSVLAPTISLEGLSEISGGRLYRGPQDLCSSS
ncbi:carbohydrate kinase family protein [Alkalihalobacillus sp. BA299]|uniref:carbohydrate kinase family protein n=1 Tax=Alkalihalobacillus sp. BA299 TaxID=2815938 RepID=UPI001ADC3F90|nr:carbohydrate kinase family protein [Alkalihalobacillus sp. BA299]